MSDREQDLVETALEWRAVMADDQVPRTTRQAFADWLAADPAHKAAFEQAEQFWDDLGALKREELDAALLRPSWGERVRPWLFRPASGTGRHHTASIAGGGLLAACLLALMVAVIVPRLPEQRAPTTYAYSTAIGEVRDVTLEDGSTVTLGARTSLDVTFDQSRRTVNLTSGEAYFAVTPDANRPFQVVVDDLRLTVLGTAFDVQHKDRLSHIAVAEGTVSVSYPFILAKAPDNAIAPVRTRTVKKLTAGQQVVASVETGLGTVTHIQPDAIGAWREHRLVYFDTPLFAIVSDANRHQDRQILIDDPSLAGLKISATFSSEDIDGMLLALTEIFPIDLQNAPSGDIVLQARR